MTDRPAAQPASPGRLRQMEIYVTGVGGARPTVPVAMVR